MPLIKGKSQKSFVKNLKTEMAAGKPQKQALAIAYSMKRKSMLGKKMSKGGNPYSEMEESKRPNMAGGGTAAAIDDRYMTKGVHRQSRQGEQGESDAGYASSVHARDIAKLEHEKKLDELKSMKGPTSGKSGFASGGTVESGDPEMDYDEGGEVGVNKSRTPRGDYGVSEAGMHARSYKKTADWAKSPYASSPSTNRALAKDYKKAAVGAHKQTLSELRSMPDPELKAEGGFIGSYQSPECPHCGGEISKESAFNEEEQQEPAEDLVSQVLMSRGGKVANTDLPEADFMPNEFDDLHLRDSLEESYTGANSGDEDGDAEEEKRRNDLVMKAMAKRRAAKRD